MAGRAATNRGRGAYEHGKRDHCGVASGGVAVGLCHGGQHPLTPSSVLLKVCT